MYVVQHVHLCERIIESETVVCELDIRANPCRKAFDARIDWTSR